MKKDLSPFSHLFVYLKAKFVYSEKVLKYDRTTTYYRQQKIS